MAIHMAQIVNSPYKKSGAGFLAASNLKRAWPLHLMMLCPMVLLFIFRYIPMVGIVIAFQDFYPNKGFFGSEWIGWEHFKTIINLPDTAVVIGNTLFISVGKIIVTTLSAIIGALLVNEIRCHLYKRAVETVSMFPYFSSWVVLGGIFVDILSLDGVINRALVSLGLGEVFFLGDNAIFPWVIIITHVWKEVGYSMVVYTAAIAGIDPTLYEAASIDGANHFRKVLHVTLPGIMPMIMLMTILSLGGILNAGFDQIWNMYNQLVYASGEIIDTYVYRTGMLNAQYSVATAVGLFKSVISCILISVSYWAAGKFAGYRVF